MGKCQWERFFDPLSTRCRSDYSNKRELFYLLGFNPVGTGTVETRNGINSEEMNRKAIHATIVRNLPSIGGSECHSREQVGRAFTEFKNPVSTISELVEAIKKGHCQGVIAL